MNKYLPFYKYIMALPLVLALSLSTVKHPYELSSSPTFGHTYRLKFNPDRDSDTVIQSHLCSNPSYPILHCRQCFPQYQSRGCYCHHHCQQPKYPLSQHKQKPQCDICIPRYHSNLAHDSSQIGLESKIYWTKTYCYFFNP